MNRSDKFTWVLFAVVFSILLMSACSFAGRVSAQPLPEHPDATFTALCYTVTLSDPADINTAVTSARVAYEARVGGEHLIGSGLDFITEVGYHEFDIPLTQYDPAPAIALSVVTPPTHPADLGLTLYMQLQLNVVVECSQLPDWLKPNFTPEPPSEPEWCPSWAVAIDGATGDKICLTGLPAPTNYNP